jgi:hypothetical protein
MQHAHNFSVRRLELVAPETLVLPDRLKQLFRWRGIPVAQEVYRATMLTPHSVKIFRPETYAAIFHAAVVARLHRKVKLTETWSVPIPGF